MLHTMSYIDLVVWYFSQMLLGVSPRSIRVNGRTEWWMARVKWGNFVGSWWLLNSCPIDSFELLCFSRSAIATSRSTSDAGCAIFVTVTVFCARAQWRQQHRASSQGTGTTISDQDLEWWMTSWSNENISCRNCNEIRFIARLLVDFRLEVLFCNLFLQSFLFSRMLEVRNTWACGRTIFEVVEVWSSR